MNEHTLQQCTVTVSVEMLSVYCRVSCMDPTSPAQMYGGGGGGGGNRQPHIIPNSYIMGYFLKLGEAQIS